MPDFRISFTSRAMGLSYGPFLLSHAPSPSAHSTPSFSLAALRKSTAYAESPLSDKEYAMLKCFKVCHHETLARTLYVIAESEEDARRIAADEFLANPLTSDNYAGETNDVSETDPAHLSPDEIYNPEGVIPERPEAPKPASYYDVIDWLEELSEKPRDDDDEALLHRFMDSDDDTLIRRLAERLATIDLDGETLNALDDDMWNAYYRERNWIIRREAEALLHDIDEAYDDR